MPGHEVCPKFRTEDLRTLIESCLNRLTTEQKQMIAAGAVDSSIWTLLSEMCLGIVEMVTVVTMEAIWPMVAFWAARYNPKEMNAHVRSDFFGVKEENLLSTLCASFPRSLAEAIQVNEVYCESSEELIKLVGKEVMREISIFISVGTDLSSLSELPSDFGTKCLPSFTALDGMVTCAARVLQYMLQLKSQDTAQGTTGGSASQSAVPPGLAPSSGAGVALSEAAALQPSSSRCTDAALPDSEQKHLNEMQSSAQKDADDEYVDFVSQALFEYIDFASSYNSSAVLEGAVQLGIFLPAHSAISEKVQKIPEERQSRDQTDTQEQSEDLTGQKSAHCGFAAASLPCPTEHAHTPASLHEDSSTGMSDLAPTTSFTESDTLKSATYYKCLVSLVLVKLLTRITEVTQTSLTLRDFSEIIEHLTDMAVKEHFGTATFMTPDDQTVEKMHKTLFGDLCRQFGSAKVLQAKMISHDPAFHNAVVQALKRHLIVSSPRPPKKCVVRRFLSRVSTAIAQPFKACRRTKIYPESSDQAKDVVSQTPIEVIYIAPEEQNTVAPKPSPVESVISSAPMSESYKAYQNLLSLLFAVLLTHTAKEAQVSLVQIDLDRILKHLTDKVLADISFNDTLINSDIRRFKKIPKALFRDLIRQFGSAKVLLEAMLLQDPAIDNAFVKTLKTHLTAFYLTQKKNTIVRFFSSVCRAIVKPFPACCGSTSDAD